MAYESFLRLQWALEEDNVLEFFDKFIIQMLLIADSHKLTEIMFITGCIMIADFLSIMIELIEIFSKIMTIGSLHILSQVADACLYCSIIVAALTFTVTKESPPLVDMI